MNIQYNLVLMIWCVVEKADTCGYHKQLQSFFCLLGSYSPFNNVACTDKGQCKKESWPEDVI